MAENRTYAEIKVGDTARLERVLTPRDLILFAHASGDLNPLHLTDRDRDGVGAAPGEATAPAMWAGGLISALLGAVLPGAGATMVRQALEFGDPLRVGDKAVATVTAREKGADRHVTFDCRVETEDARMVAEGEAVVVAPADKLATDADDLPDVGVHSHVKFDRLVDACAGLQPLVTAVVAPEDAASLEGAMTAAARGLIVARLIGDAGVIERLARDLDIDLDGVELIDVRDHARAAELAVTLVKEGRAGAIMKGKLHTDELMSPVVAGLRGERRISHAFVLDVPGRDRFIMVSDAAINIAPDLAAKVDIVQNAIDLGHAIGLSKPKVGVLSAVETVTPKIPSTLDAAALAKMSERGQITGGLVDGPLAMDNAIDVEAAGAKGIASLVAGRAEILIPPNLEAANMLAKELTFVGHAEAAGLVLGAAVPVMLTSRADNARARLASCALALLYDHWRRTGASLIPDAVEPREATP